MSLLLRISLLLLSCSFLFLLYAVQYFYRSLKPRRFITPLQPAYYGLPSEKIDLKTEDGILLAGWFLRNQESHNAIVICHGYPFDKGNVLPLAKFLFTQYNVLLFDFRAMGESEGNLTTIGYLETLDLKSAVEWLKKRNMQKIGVLGLSMGASVALLECDNRGIQAIIADSPFSSLDELLSEMFQSLFFLGRIFKKFLIFLGRAFLHMDIDKISPIEKISFSQSPILMIHGDQDHQISVNHSRRMKARYPDIEYWEIPGVHHVEAHDIFGEAYEKRVLNFLDSAFLKKG